MKKRTLLLRNICIILIFIVLYNFPCRATGQNDSTVSTSPTPTPDSEILEQQDESFQSLSEFYETIENDSIQKATSKKAKPVTPKIIINPYTNIVNQFITQNNKIIKKKELDQYDRELLKNRKLEAIRLKAEIETYISTLWEKKKNSKPKCEDCDILIKSSQTLCSNLEKNQSRIVYALKNVSDYVVMSWKIEFWNLVLPAVSADSIALAEINAEIDKRTQNSLWGWAGMAKVNEKLKNVEANYNRILTESKEFILEKQKDYDDENDKAMVADLENEIPEFYREITFCKNNLNLIKIPVVKISVVGVVLLLLLVGVTFYISIIFRNKRIEKKEQEKFSAPQNALFIEEDDILELKAYKVEMWDIKEKTGIDYLEIKMLDMVEDSAVRNIYLSRGAICSIYEFFSNFFNENGKAKETGCFLTGRWEYVPDAEQQVYDISIEDIVIPGDDAIYGEYTLNFGAKIGITLNYAIEKLCEETGFEYVHTAWMHTHPGLGLFLSQQDIIVQSQLAHSQHQGRLLAIVMDSNTPDLKMAFFTPQKNGTMNNDKNLKKLLSLEELYQWAKTNEPLPIKS